MKKILFIYTFVLLTNNIFSQYVEYGKIIIKAQDYIVNNQLDSALFLYKKAFSIVNKPFPKDFSNAALTAYLLDSTLLMRNYAKCAIINGNNTRLTKKKFRGKIRSIGFWKSIEDQLAINKENKVNDTIYNILNNMFRADQKARIAIFNKKNKIHVTDSLNSIKLSKILIENKFPGYITIGARKSVIITVVFFLHFPVNNYTEHIEYAVESGEISPSWAMFAYIRQYKFINGNTCPTAFPVNLKNTYKRYVGEKYINLTKSGYDFNYHL